MKVQMYFSLELKTLFQRNIQTIKFEKNILAKNQVENIYPEIHVAGVFLRQEKK